MIKAAVKRVLAYFGIGLVRLESSPDGQGWNIRSAVHHNSPDRLQELWSDPQMVRDHSGEGRLELFRCIVDMLAEKGIGIDGRTVADVGCGTGHLLLAVARKHRPARLTGFEYVPAAVDAARRTVPGGDVRRLDLYEGTPDRFDVVLCVEVLEHLLHPDRALHSLADMISDGGVAVVTVPDGRRDTFPGHINFWSPESWDVFLHDRLRGVEVETGRLTGGVLFAVLRKTAPMGCVEAGAS